MAEKILIVDDEPSIRMLLQQSLEELEELGVKIFTATNGHEALEIFAAEHPRLMILDVMMPGPNGFEVCQKIKARSDADGTHVIILTAKGQEADRDLGIKAGADSYMTKPFDPDVVLAKARELLGLEP